MTSRRLILIATVCALMAAGCGRGAGEQAGEKGRRLVSFIDHRWPNYALFDPAGAGNADYRHNVFFPYHAEEETVYVTNHFPSLAPGVHVWKGAPFYLPPPLAESDAWPSINSRVESGLLPLRFKPRRLRRLLLAVSGGFIPDERGTYLCDLILRYEDGGLGREKVVAGENVFEYWQKKVAIPPEKLLFDGGEEGLKDQLALMTVDVDPARALEGIDIFDNPANEAALVIFAITGELAPQ